MKLSTAAVSLQNTTNSSDAILYHVANWAHCKRSGVGGDMVIEILSPATAYYDLISKKRLYGKHGVSEYWIIDPKEGFVEVYENTDGDMQLAQKVEKKAQFPPKW